MNSGRMGGGKGRWKRKERKVGVLKGCEAVEIGAGGRGVTRPNLNISQSTEGLK